MICAKIILLEDFMNYELRQFYTTFSREEVWRHLDGGFGSGSRMVFYHSFWFLGTIGASNGSGLELDTIVG